jgi:hypothetical protein
VREGSSTALIAQGEGEGAATGANWTSMATAAGGWIAIKEAPLIRMKQRELMESE